MSIRPLRWILLGPALVLLLLGHGHAFGTRWQDPPPGQPEQMRSRVDYDRNLTDPFFKLDEYLERTFHDIKRPKQPLRVKQTANCFSTSFGVKHKVRCCQARLIDANMIELFVYDPLNAGFDDNLTVQIRNGMFTCQFWTLYKGGPQEGLTWTTKWQKLTLDKKTCRKGDVIKGRIALEVLDELINSKYPDRPPRRIKLYGVFKTILE
jgi:hypothetical protein